MNASPTAANGLLIWLLPVGLLVAVGMGVWLWPRGETAPANSPASNPATPAAPVSVSISEPVAASSADAPERTLPPVERTAPPASPDRPQGLRGIALDAANRPVGGVDVHLCESAGNDPLLLPMIQQEQQQHFLAPVASTRTAADGAFALGLEVVQDKVYEVYIVSPRHATARLTGLRLLPTTWHDLGVITLDDGAVLRGRVTVAGRPGVPVPQAVVTIETGGAFADALLRALPGEQALLVAQVDALGNYELRRAPSRGVLRVSAMAPGFARITKLDIEMSSTAPVTVDFELPAGQSLAGEVHDEQGRPIAHARIEAWPSKAGEAALTAFADEQGRFVLHGLGPSGHRIRAAADGYETRDLPAVTPDAAPSEGDLSIVLARRSGVRVIARTPAGQVLRRYRLALRRFFPIDPEAPLDATALRAGNIGTVMEVPEQHVRLDGVTDFATIEGIPTGTFVCEVEADGYAKTLSAPLRCPATEPGGETRIVEIVLTQGVRLLGRVLDDRGQPLAGATVTTQQSGTMPDNPLLRMLQGAASRITRRSVETAADGSFSLEPLALAAYQLQIEHPDACRLLVPDLQLQVVGDHTLPPLRMTRGAIVQGTAMVDGRVAGQMKVVLTTSPSASASLSTGPSAGASTGPQPAAADSLRLETITDERGRYRFDRRVPPGVYELRAAVVGGSAPESEIFHQLLQLQRSATTLSVLAGQDVAERHLDLPSAN